jgi:hypothetical protein
VAVRQRRRLLAFLLRRPVTGPRLIVEAFAVSLAVMVVFRLGGLLLWVIDHRW